MLLLGGAPNGIGGGAAACRGVVADASPVPVVVDAISMVTTEVVTVEEGSVDEDGFPWANDEELVDAPFAFAGTEKLPTEVEIPKD